MTTFGRTEGTESAATERATGELPFADTELDGAATSMMEELDRLAERVEMARATIGKLREDNEELRARSDDLRAALGRYEAASSSPEEMAESAATIGRLEKERQALLTERADVARRVRSILGRVESLEGLS